MPSSAQSSIVARYCSGRVLVREMWTCSRSKAVTWIPKGGSIFSWRTPVAGRHSISPAMIPPGPSGADPWPADRCVPADALRRALLELQRHPDRADPRGLRIVGADFGERIDLQNVRVPCPLWLERSRLRAGADLDGAHLIELSLARSTWRVQRTPPPWPR